MALHLKAKTSDWISFPFQLFRHLSSLPPISWTLAIWRICIQMYKSKIKPSRLKVVFLVYSTLAKYIMYFQYITCFSIKINFNVLNKHKTLWISSKVSAMPLKNLSHLSYYSYAICIWNNVNFCVLHFKDQDFTEHYLWHCNVQFSCKYLSILTVSH